MRARKTRGGGAGAAVLVGAFLAGCVALIPAVVVVSAAADCNPAAIAAADLAETEIPADYLVRYQQAGAASGVPWTVLAAIGWVETRHGTLDAPGVRSGANSAGAAGPMQFGIGGRAGNTWGGQPIRAVPPVIPYGVDGDGDGVADVYDPADAIPAAAGYLVANGAPQDLRRAIFAYNHADWYVDEVLAKTADYGIGGAVVADAVGYLPSGCSPYGGDYPPGGGAGPWGGYHNGRIPPDVLCPINASGSHRLRCDAAEAFIAMDAAHRAALGRAIPVTDSYRDYDAQVEVYRRKPHLAARPGTSNHGWALAVDISVGGFNGEVFAWLQANAHRYGWHHPPWARIDGSKPEPWHWEYAGGDR